MMRFMFKPSVSYALLANVAIMVGLSNSGHWIAALVWLLVSSVAGGITETIVMDRAA